MLEGTFGIRLVLLVGQTVPLPAPYELASSLARVETINDSSSGDGFQLTFVAGRSRMGDYSLLEGNTLAEMNRVVIGIMFGVMPEVLIDGVITHTQVNPGSLPSQATITVTGRDLSALMDLEDKNDSFENQPDSVIAMRVLANYARYGVIPDVSPTTDVPIMLERIPRQQETDLRFLQRLAQRNGFVFNMEPVTFGVSKAHWGAEVRVGLPQPALSIDLGAATNVRQINFSDDALAAEGSSSTIVEPITRTAIPVPPLPSLRVPPLVSSPATAHRTSIRRDTANMNASTAATRTLAGAMSAADPATAEGELDGVRYGTALRARKLVGVRGAGMSHDGMWYVRRVNHSISRGEYTQRFTLSREGRGTTSPVVRT